MNILAIDPGTKCGWALYRGGRLDGSGVWDLKIQRHEGEGIRWIRFRKFLDLVENVDLVAFEEVRHHAGVIAAHTYGAMVAIITAWAEANKVQYVSVPVGTVKKFATGKGNADKGQMIEACQEKLNIQTNDDNEADALWILEWAKENYGGEKALEAH